MNIHENIATIICHLASKMPYCAEEDAQRDWAYLTNRWTTKSIIVHTNIRGPKDLIDRAIQIRAAAEIAAASQEVAA